MVSVQRQKTVIPDAVFCNPIKFLWACLCGPALEAEKCEFLDVSLASLRRNFETCHAMTKFSADKPFQGHKMVSV